MGTALAACNGPFWRAFGTICRGWLTVKKGDVTEGITLLRSGIAAFRATGSEAWTPYYFDLKRTESLLTRRWRELDSNFQFLDLGKAFFTPLQSLEPQTLCQFKPDTPEAKPG